MTVKAEVIEKNGQVCPYQLAFILDNWLRKLIQSPKKIIGDYVKEGDTVLDVGCGPGYFSIDMAKMVGSKGKIIAADLQPQMLEKVKKKATRHKVQDRITYHQCQPDSIGLKSKVDFALAFYMIHETGNPEGFLKEIKQLLNPGGKLLIVEPKMHVSQELFESLIKDAEAINLKVKEFPKNKGGRSVLLTT